MGGKTTTTQFTDKNPWAPAQADLKLALGGAQDAYNSTYNGTGVAAMDPNVTNAQNMMLANAGTNSLGNLGAGAIGNFAGTMANGGLSQAQSGAMSGIGSALGDFSGQMSKAQEYLNPYASGKYLSEKNPYFDRALGDSMTAASEMTNRQFSGAGRYGSGAHSGTLGQSLGRIATDANMQEYTRQQQNQLGAIGQMGNLASSGLSGILGGQSALSSLGQQGIANTGAIASAIPGLQQAQNADASTMSQIGAQNMDYQQSLIDAANQNPWTKVGNLAQIAGGIGGLGGTSYTTGTQKNDPGVAGIIGGGMAGLGALGNLAKAGGFAALFSDERLKENARPIGVSFDGQPIHAYNYKGDPTPRIGLMAQEVAARKPHAVRVHDSGYMMVDYGKALEDA